MKRLTLLLVVVLSLGACASVQEYKQDKALLLNPARINEGPDSTGRAQAAQEIQVAAYYAAMKLAQTDYSKAKAVVSAPEAVANYIEEGIALNTAYCRRWFHRIDDKQRQFAMSTRDVNLITALGTTALGIVEASAKVVTVWGAGLTALSGASDNINTTFFAAPTAKGVESRILQVNDTYGTQLRSEAKNLKFPAAFTRLEAMADICTYSSIKDLTDKAVSATDIEVSATGALSIKTK